MTQDELLRLRKEVLVIDNTRLATLILKLLEERQELIETLRMYRFAISGELYDINDGIKVLVGYNSQIDAFAAEDTLKKVEEN